MSLAEGLQKALEQSGLDAIAGQLINLSKESAAMKCSAVSDQTIPIASSKLGGSPDLPCDLEWPEWKTGNLSFVTQLNLAEVPRNGLLDLLPASGLLSFFYDREQSAWGFDPAHKDGFRLWYFPETSGLIRKSAPTDSTFSCARLTYEPFLSLPDPGSSPVSDLVLDLENDDTYRDFWEKYASTGPRHQLLGWPRIIQSEMELECQLASNGLYLGDTSGYRDARRKELEAGASDWMLLFQIDTDESTKMMWGDSGMLYVWIRYPDLKLRKFDKAWTILQCY